MKPPIFVTGSPRSLTSVFSHILQACGAFTKDTREKDRCNAGGYFEDQGFFEHMGLLSGQFSRYKVAAGLGGISAGDPRCDSFFNTVRGSLFSWMQVRGYPGDGPWFIKNPSLLFDRSFCDALFPGAQWVLTARDENEVRQSYIEYIQYNIDQGNEDFLFLGECDEFLSSFFNQAAIFKSSDLSHYEIAVAKAIRSGDLSPIKDVVEGLGLTWNEEAVRKIVRRGLIHHTIDPNGSVA